MNPRSSQPCPNGVVNGFVSFKDGKAFLRPKSPGFPSASFPAAEYSRREVTPEKAASPAWAEWVNENPYLPSLPHR